MTNYKRINGGIFLILIFLGFSLACDAQILRTEVLSVESEAYKRLATKYAPLCPSGSRWYVNVVFGKAFIDISQAENAGNYVIYDLTLLGSSSKSFFSPIKAKNLAESFNVNSPIVGLCFTEELKKPKDSLLKNQYQLKTTNISFKEKEPPKPDDLSEVKLSSLSFVDKNDNPSGATPTPAKHWKAPENSDDANIYISGEVSRASGTKFIGSADIRLEYRWDKNVNTIRPYFTLKASSDPEADPDTMKFGIGWNRQLRDYGGKVLLRAKSIVESGIEAERDFDTANFSTSAKFYLQSKRGGPIFRNLPYFDIFGGGEFGKNLRAPIREADGKPISRLVMGVNTGKKFRFENPFLDHILFSGKYERRILLLREVGFEKAEDDSLRPVFYDKRPRDWVETKLTFLTKNKFWGFYVSYEYGELPPAYKLVDHKGKFGLVFSAVRSAQTDE